MPGTEETQRGRVKLSICEFTTLHASFEEDLVAYAAAGAGGIGVCELKIADDPDAIAQLRASGLVATHCVPTVPSILPLPLMEGPTRPEERVEALCASVARLAELEPSCVIFLTGPKGELDEDEARQIVRDGISAIAAAAERAGVPVALEPIHASQADIHSFVHTIPDALALIDEARANVGILLDTFHVSEPEAIRTAADRIVGVHISDRREQTRSHFDRTLPGDGVIDLPPVFRALEESGYAGWYDVEIFSDNGVFGEHFPDSLWDLPAAEVAQRVHDSFTRVWECR